MSYFRQKCGNKPYSVKARIAEIEERIENASDMYKPGLYNRAGDLTLESADETRALEFFSKAINGYIDNGSARAARVVCEKILRHIPSLVRAHCTLLWIALIDENTTAARKHLDDYVEAALLNAQTSAALKQLMMLATVADIDLLEDVGIQFLKLGNYAAAEWTLRSMYSTRSNLACTIPITRDVTWATAVRAMSMTPNELNALDPVDLIKAVNQEGGSPTLNEALKSDPTVPDHLKELTSGVSA